MPELYPFPYNRPAFVFGGEWYERARLSKFGAEQTQIPNKLTPMTADAVASAVSDAFRQLTGSRPSRQVLALLLAQWALESGNGAATHNYNLTNIKRNSGDPYYQYFRCSEIVNGKEVFFDPPSAQCAFAAYKNPVDGAVAYIRILQKRPHWWKGLLTGDIAKFNEGLSTAPKFYTASPQLYLKVLQDRYAKYFPQAAKYGASLWRSVMSAILGVGLGSAALAGALYNFPSIRPAYLKDKF